MSNTIMNTGGLQALFQAEWSNWRDMRAEARTKQRDEPEQPTLASTLDSWTQMPPEVRDRLMPDGEDWTGIEDELTDLIFNFGPDYLLGDLPEGEIVLSEPTTIKVTTTCQAELTEEWTLRVGPAGLALLRAEPAEAIDLIHGNGLAEFVKVDDVKVDHEQDRDFQHFDIIPEQPAVTESDDDGEYLVTWSMPITADDPTDAAQQALGTHRDPASIATVFVVEKAGRKVVVDLHADGTVSSVRNASA